MSMEEASIYWWKMMNLSLLLPTKKQRKTYLSCWGVRMCWTNNITCTIMYPIWIFLMIPHRILTKTKWIIYTWIYSIKQYVIFIIYIYISIWISSYTLPYPWLAYIYIPISSVARIFEVNVCRPGDWWWFCVGKPWENHGKTLWKWWVSGI